MKKRHRYKIREGSIAYWASKTLGVLVYMGMLAFLMYEIANEYVKNGGF